MKSRYKRSQYTSKEAPNWILKTTFFFLCLLILTDAYFIGKGVIRLIKEYPKNVTVNILVLFTLICICAAFMLFEYRPNGLFDDARELFRRYKERPSVDEADEDDDVKDDEVDDHYHTLHDPSDHSKSY